MAIGDGVKGSGGGTPSNQYDVLTDTADAAKRAGVSVSEGTKAAGVTAAGAALEPVPAHKVTKLSAEHRALLAQSGGDMAKLKELIALSFGLPKDVVDYLKNRPHGDLGLALNANDSALKREARKA